MSQILLRPWLAWSLALVAFVAALLVPTRPGILVVAFGGGLLALGAYAWGGHQAAEAGESIPPLFHGVLVLGALALGVPGLSARRVEAVRPPAAPSPASQPGPPLQAQDQPQVPAPAQAPAPAVEGDLAANAKAESQFFRVATLVREVNMAGAGGPNSERLAEHAIEGAIHEAGAYPNPYTGVPTHVIRAERPTQPGEIALWPGTRAATPYRPAAKTVEIRILLLKGGGPELKERTLEVLE